MQDTSPATWITAAIAGLKWPAIVAAAYWSGRRHEKLSTRVDKAEKRLANIDERHLPAVHRMLAEIKGLLLRR
jgi:hypothetical protein